MVRFATRSVAVMFLAAVAVAQDQPKPDKFSPLGFYDLRAYEQAYPADVGSPQAVAAATNKYWAYQGVALRGNGAPASVWASLGPLSYLQVSVPGATFGSPNISGRVAALAISPTCDKRCRLWVGTAGGGVWRSDDAMNTDDARWRWIGHGLGTNSIGSLTVDPNDPSGDTIFVGTGETNQPNNSAAGTGLYRSTDGGDHWLRIPTMITDPVVQPTAIDFTFTRGISSVVIEPGNSQVIYVGTASAMLGMTAVRGGQTQTTGFPQPRTALYKTTNGGATWTQLWVPALDPVIPANPNLGQGVGDTMFGIRKVKLDPRDSHIVYVTAWNNAIHRSAPSLEGGDASFKPVFALVNALRFQDIAMFDLTVKSGHTRIYAYNGTAELPPQSLYRLDNADVPASSLVTGSGSTLTNTASWKKMTSEDVTNPASVSWRICSSQCFYDMVVAVPDGQPDTVLLAGVQSPLGSESVIRSTNGGATFQGIGHDSQNPRGSSHVDIHAIVFHPRDNGIVFVGSDGGVVRTDGTYVDITNRCSQLLANVNATVCRSLLSAVPGRLYYLNKGLQTLQFYNVALDPAAPLTRMLGGLQDNGTIWQDGTGDPLNWKPVFPSGDGTSACGFHPTKSNILFASFQSNNFYTNFRNGDLSRWVYTAGPIATSGERATITASTGRQFITFDRVNPDAQFTGFQHVWRTQNNGGAQATLEAQCGSAASSACGDWVPLGVAYPFAAASTATSDSRKPGDLTSDFYGTDRAGGLIVAAERTPADAGTLWAATNFGRVFVSKNADAAGATVAFARIDTPTTPNRFVTRIVADRKDANTAIISYSGFNTITPQTPGHIFRAVYDPAKKTATFTPLDFDVGDLPINTLAFDDVLGDLYAATDYGPLILPAGQTHWSAAGAGFPEAVMVDLEMVADKRLLVAATHGLGIYYLILPKAPASDLRGRR